METDGQASSVVASSLQGQEETEKGKFLIPMKITQKSENS